MDSMIKLAFERTYLANERTQIAWIRTALALISFGFSITKFHQFLPQRGRQTMRFVLQDSEGRCGAKGYRETPA